MGGKNELEVGREKEAMDGAGKTRKPVKLPCVGKRTKETDRGKLGEATKRGRLG